MKVLLTGSQGFIGPYICRQLLAKNYQVVGVDNLQKYGSLPRSHDNDENFTFYNLDIVNDDFTSIVLEEKPDIIIANAAIIGGLEYINNNLYTMYATNEKILLKTIDATIALNNIKPVHRLVYMSSSYIFQHTKNIPFKESDLSECAIPSSFYAFQKLSGEYLVKSLNEQFKIPYTIIRPFNCIGLGEEIQANNAVFKNIKSSHVVPDLIKKIKSGQEPLKIWGSGNQIRCFTHAEDIARAIWLALESENAINEDFNISSNEQISILQLANLLWNKININREFSYELEPSFKDDVQVRIPDTQKAKDLLGFNCQIKLDNALDEIIKGIKI